MKENWGHQDRKLKIELNVSNDTVTMHAFCSGLLLVHTKMRNRPVNGGPAPGYQF